MAKTPFTPAWQTALIVLTSTVVGTVAISVLYIAQSICIPIALAIFFTFLLSPLVTALHRFGVGRTVAVLLVVLATGLFVGGVIWVVGVQARDLAVESPKYSANIKEKIKSLQHMFEDDAAKRLRKMIGEVRGMLKSPSPDQAAGNSSESADAPKRPSEVVMQSEIPFWVSSLPSMLGHLAEDLGGMMMALVLLIFMLLKREDLRNRLLRLVGHGRITGTTKALDDAGRRISQYLLMQLIINGAFGLAISLGLWVIGIPFAFLWGFLAFMLRYVPYVGAWIAAIPPILLSLIMVPGWFAPLFVFGLFMVIELITGNVIEPRVYGRSIGVSEVALLVAAAFWAFLWGPIGLVLANPLTVCLMVLGKYVPQLQFLDVLLGDEPVLSPGVVFYQRLLAHDQDEASELVMNRVKATSPELVYDEMLIQALSHVKRDYDRGHISDADAEFVFQATTEILEDLDDKFAALRLGAKESSTPLTSLPKVRFLACPAHDQSDRLALMMLRQLLESDKWEVEVTAIETLTSEVLESVAEQAPDLVCIGALPPGGLAHARYLCKRLRSSFPEIKILVGRFGLQGNVQSNQERLQEAGGDTTVVTLIEMRNQLNSLRPILLEKQNRSKEVSVPAETLEPVLNGGREH